MKLDKLVEIGTNEIEMDLSQNYVKANLLQMTNSY